MKQKKRQKMCHNCEGEIDVDVIVCPYCAADLREEKPERQVTPLYNPQPQPLKDHNLYGKPLPTEQIQEEASVQTEAPHEKKEKNLFLPTLVFTLGVQLCLLGLLMLLFSHKGVVILKWDARFWFLYVFFSVPLLILGYKNLSKI